MTTATATHHAAHDRPRPRSQGRPPKPAGDLAGRSPADVCLHVELHPALLATIIAVAEAAPSTVAGTVRVLIAEGLASRGYTWQTGEHDGREIAPADPALVGRVQGWPRVSVSLPVTLVACIDDAAEADPVPEDVPHTSRQAMARVLLGEALTARGVSWRTGKRLAG